MNRTYIFDNFLGRFRRVRSQRLLHFARVENNHVESEGNSLLIFREGLWWRGWVAGKVETSEVKVR